MNMVGANRVGTVGEPLPDTELRTTADDEVIVRGPQVVRGYWNSGEIQPFKDGWLYTGDLGRITEDNSLVISGRKQEIIITSYGKKIQPTKIEDKLKSIADVSETMVLGDGHPYCTAVIWVKPGHFSKNIDKHLRQAIQRINTQLSHPEQIKRWVVMEYNLSIEHGEVTNTLKLKRSEVTKTLAGIIESLYSQQLPVSTEAVLYCDIASKS
jgi:long-chain acyl-CoA synthetase